MLDEIIPILDLQIGLDKLGFPVSIAYDPEFMKKVLEQEAGVENLVAEVLAGFLLEFCEEKKIDLDLVLRSQTTKKKLDKILYGNE